MNHFPTFSRLYDENPIHSLWSLPIPGLRGHTTYKNKAALFARHSKTLGSIAWASKSPRYLSSKMTNRPKRNANSLAAPCVAFTNNLHHLTCPAHHFPWLYNKQQNRMHGSYNKCAAADSGCGSAEMTEARAQVIDNDFVVALGVLSGKALCIVYNIYTVKPVERKHQLGMNCYVTA